MLKKKYDSLYLSLILYLFRKQKMPYYWQNYFITCMKYAHAVQSDYAAVIKGTKNIKKIIKKHKEILNKSIRAL